jgi:peptidoglycan/LPS O-acetylase OafA/YrhL
MAEFLIFGAMAVFVVGIYPLFLSLIPRKSQWLEEKQPLPTVAGRLPFFDLVKGLAIIAVVLIHVTLLFPIETITIDQSTLDLFNNLLRFAIAFFLIASGLLLRPLANTLPAWQDFYGRKVWRIVVPYLLIVLIFGWYQGIAWSALWYQALTGEVSTPFYFMSVLIQLYLLYPILQFVATKWWFVVASLGLSSAAAFIPALYTWNGIPLAVPFLFFFVWGIYMRPAILEGRVPKQWWLWLAIVGLYLMVQTGVGLERMYNLRFFFGPAAFLLVYWIYIRGWFESWFITWMARVGQLSLWVFLLHFPILQFLITETTPYLWNLPLLVLVGYSLIGTGLSIAAAAVVAKAYAATMTVIVPTKKT